MQRLIAGGVFVSIYEFRACGTTWVWAVPLEEVRHALAFLEGRSNAPVIGRYLTDAEWRGASPAR
jgi:hypothetical protein